MSRIVRTRLLQVVAAGALMAAWSFGCDRWWDSAAPAGPGDVLDADTGIAGDGSIFRGAGVGGSCSEQGDCRHGLSCRAGLCEPSGQGRLDEKCVLAAECAGPGAECPNGLTCGWFGFCTCAGDGVDGESCTSASDCARGWSCVVTGLAGYCVRPSANAGDIGASCMDTQDCMAGLVCSSASRTCVAGSLLLNPDIFGGVSCPDESDMPFGIRMRLPGDDDDPGDFYSLPFPIDIRRGPDGRPSLATHPRPGGGIFGFDSVDAVIRTIEAEESGFSVNPAVTFRFTAPVDPATLRAVPDPDTGDQPTIRFVNLDDPTQAIPVLVQYKEQRNKYRCASALVVRPGWAHSLGPQTRYGVVVTKGVRSAPQGTGDGGGPASAPKSIDSLSMLLAGGPPVDNAERNAWNSFEPLRTWLASEGIAAGDVAGATVFTTGDPVAPMRALADVFHPGGDGIPKLETPGLTKVSVCGVDPPIQECLTPGTPAQDSRVCEESASTQYTEIHALIRLPVFQEGAAPYATSGGSIPLDGGQPEPVRYQEVCMALTLPNGEPPATGWPLLVYGHGTGGNFRSGVRWAGPMASAGVAVVGIDGVLHGPRQGQSAWVDPGPLFYNFVNPRAARGNLFQGAADNFSLIRWARGFQGTMGGRNVRFDSGRIAYMGHSQGATTGPLFVPWEDGLGGAVFTGAGGSLLWGLLGKKQPHDASIGLRAGFQEMQVDQDHPVLNLIQWAFDAGDPMLYAPLMAARPVGKALHVLNILGWDDTYSPWRTGVVFGAALGGPLIHHPAGRDCRPKGCDAEALEPGLDLGMSLIQVPVGTPYGLNLDDGTGTNWSVYTVPSRSDGTYDGHFVAERNPATRTLLLGFLETLLGVANSVPTITMGENPCPAIASAQCPR